MVPISLGDVQVLRRGRVSSGPVRVAGSDLIEKAHEAELVVGGLLGTDVSLAEEVLPPLLALLAQVPLLQVVDQSDVVVLPRRGRRLDAPQTPPERGRCRQFTHHTHDEQGVVDQVKSLQELCVDLQLSLEFPGEAGIDVEVVFKSEEVEILEYTSGRLQAVLVVLERHTVFSGTLHVIGTQDSLTGTPCIVLHEEDVIGLFDLAVVDGEDAIGLGNEGVRVGLEVQVELLQFFQQEVEFLLRQCLEDESAVGSEEEELPASPPVALHHPVQLVAVLQQSEAPPHLPHSLFLQQPPKDSRSQNRELPTQQRHPRQDMGCLLVVSNQFGPNLEADLFAEMQAFEWVGTGEGVGRGEVLLVGDADAGENGNDLCDSDEVDLVLLLLDVQDLFLHAGVHEIRQLAFVQSFFLHRQRTLHVGLAEKPSKQFLHFLANLFVGQHHADKVEELHQSRQVEDCRPDQHGRVRREAVQVQHQRGRREHQKDDRHADHETGHYCVFLELATVQRCPFRHVAPVVAMRVEGEPHEGD